MIEFTPFIIAGFIFLTLSIVLRFFLKKNRFPYYSRGTLLTKAELKFYYVLKSAIGQDYNISCKTRLADIVNCSTSDWHKGFGPKISSKHIDFVLTDPETSEIILCIELDDKTHRLPERQKRDIFVNRVLEKTNTAFYRVPAASSYDLSKIMLDIRVILK